MDVSERESDILGNSFGQAPVCCSADEFHARAHHAQATADVQSFVAILAIFFGKTWITTPLVALGSIAEAHGIPRFAAEA